MEVLLVRSVVCNFGLGFHVFRYRFLCGLVLYCAFLLSISVISESLYLGVKIAECCILNVSLIKLNTNVCSIVRTQ